MRVLYLSYDGMSDPLGQSQVLPYISRLARDYEIVLLSFEKKERLKKSFSELKTLIEKSGIKWVPLTYTKKPPIVSTLYDLMRMWRRSKELHHSRPFDVVHCRSYVCSLVGLKFKKQFGLKFIFDMRGFWADERVDGKIWNLKNPVYRFVYNYFKRKEKAFLINADYTITLTYASRDIIHSWKEIPGQPISIEVIPCCADLELFHPGSCNVEEVRKLKMRHGINDSNYVLMYSGSIGTWYMLDEMLMFFKRLLRKKPNALFLIVTLESESAVRDKLINLGIPVDKVVITAASRKEMPAFIKMADMTLFFIKPVFSKKASSPTKQGEIMGMGVPVICNAGVGDTDSVIEKYHSGFIVSEFSENEYDRVIARLDTEVFSADEIMNGAAEFYSLDVGAERYGRVYEKLRG